MDARKKRSAAFAGALFAAFLFMPALAWAQGSAIYGVVRDSSGAILPGVTVEASSPALIEQSRTAVTDAEGVYRIIDLRPGTYTVTFTLPGFSVIRREGVELSANFTATINADLQVGAIEQAVTVTGASPVVDVVNTVKQEIVTQEMLETLPISKSLASFTAVVPGLGGARDIGGISGDRPIGLTIHGSRGNDQHVFYNGMRTNNMNAGGSTGGGASSSIYYNPAMIQEITLEVSAQSVASETGGVTVNVIPKEGGNMFNALVILNGTNGALQQNNLNDELRAQGVTTPQENKVIWDFNPGGGGPIARNKLWYYAAYRWWGSEVYIPGAFFNGSPDSWTPTQDLSRPAYDENTAQSKNLRITWQVDNKNKLSFGYENQDRCLCFQGVSPTTLPEASQHTDDHSKYWQVKWTNPLTNQLLLQAGVQGNFMNWRGAPQPGVPEDLYSVVETSTGVRFRNTTIYNSRVDGEGYNSNTYNMNASLDYIAGAHKFTVGGNLMVARPVTDFNIDGGREYRLLRGLPSQVIQYTTPYKYSDNLQDLAIWVSDQWRLDRLTLGLGVRYAGLYGGTPEQHIEAGDFIPERVFPEISGVVGLHDLLPRLGAAYDLFGNGRTAVKVALNKFLQGQGTNLTSAKNPQFTVVNNVSRSWDDRDGDFVPDCDLTSIEISGECGAVSNRAFGQTLTPTTVWDDALLHGWGSRPQTNWEFSAGFQHEVLSNMSVSVGYFRRDWARFTVNDNLLTTPADYDPYCALAPVDARLPGGGGYEVCGLYDIKRDKFGQVSQVTTLADHFGERTEVYQGLDLTVNGRLERTTITGGVNLGRTATNDCEIITDSPQKQFCDQTPPFFQPDLKLSASRELPWDMQASATLQSSPGPQITASYTITSSQAIGLGRPLSAGTAAIALIEPGTIYNDRYTQLDARLTKSVRLASRSRLRVMVDAYNLFNSATSLSHNNTYGGQWLRPQTLMPGRFVKFGAQVDF